MWNGNNFEKFVRINTFSQRQQLSSSASFFSEIAKIIDYFSRRRGNDFNFIFTNSIRWCLKIYWDEGYRFIRRMNLSFSSGSRIFWCGWHCSWNWFGNRLSPTFTLIRSGIKPRADWKYNPYLLILLYISFNQQCIFISRRFLKVFKDF